MKLYSYFRSSAAYRVRLALAIKGLTAELIPVHLVKNGGEQHLPSYREIHPGALVPAWVDEDLQLTQSLSIMEYLEERYPTPALLPDDPAQRALIRAFCLSIACDIHPLNNLRVLQYLSQTLGVDEQAKNDWYAHWIHTGFASLERQLQHSNGQFCFGEHATLADCCLIPQVYNAYRFQIDLSAYPKIEAIYRHCTQLPAFQQAAPDAQPDAT